MKAIILVFFYFLNDAPVVETGMTHTFDPADLTVADALSGCMQQGFADPQGRKFRCQVISNP